jgi:hypothetical protein
MVSAGAMLLDRLGPAGFQGLGRRFGPGQGDAIERAHDLLDRPLRANSGHSSIECYVTLHDATKAT